MKRLEKGYTDEKIVGDWKIVHTETDKMVFHPGCRLAVTDPCYFFANEGMNSELWSAIVDLHFPVIDGEKYESRSGFIQIRNTKHFEKYAIIFFGATAHGDGEYPVVVKTGQRANIMETHGSTGVDSGTIAVANIEQVKQFSEVPEIEDEVKRNGVLTEATAKNITVEYDGNGNFVGDVSVFTEDDEEEWEEE